VLPSPSGRPAPLPEAASGSAPSRRPCAGRRRDACPPRAAVPAPAAVPPFLPPDLRRALLPLFGLARPEGPTSSPSARRPAHRA
jgi:hypothetical protein